MEILLVGRPTRRQKSDASTRTTRAAISFLQVGGPTTILIVSTDFPQQQDIVAGSVDGRRGPELDQPAIKGVARQRFALLRPWSSSCPLLAHVPPAMKAPRPAGHGGRHIRSSANPSWCPSSSPKLVPATPAKEADRHPHPPGVVPTSTSSSPLPPLEGPSSKLVLVSRKPCTPRRGALPRPCADLRRRCSSAAGGQVSSVGPRSWEQGMCQN
jgi:hypothetical protein